MELYILDGQMRRVEVRDNFQSLIWTERWQDQGDFELVTESNFNSLLDYVPGTWLATNVSNRIMRVDGCVDAVDSEGKKVLNVSGTSFEAQMYDRATVDAYVNSNGAGNNWKITDQPADIVRELFRKIAHQNTTIPADNFPFMAFGNMYPADTIAEPGDLIELEVEPQTLFQLVQDMCKLYDLGFRITRNGDASQLFFNVYSGNDRTTRQTANPAIIFSEAMDNLQNTSAVKSIAEEKNVAYVYSKNATQVVYWNPEDATATGVNRKVLIVQANDVDETLTGADLYAVLRQRGLLELAKHRPVRAFDGEIPQRNAYLYDIDYRLGDLVEVRNPNITNIMRVTEQIFVQDREGFKSYPTLSIYDMVTEGDWMAFENNIDWVAAPGTWSTQP